MKASTRVIVNTGAQYLRTGLTVLITLYTSRIVLEYLGANDYGIFSLVASVLSMLAFIQVNLARSIQRFLSYYHGRGDTDTLRALYNNSVITQIVISVALCGVLFGVGPMIFDSGLVKIDPAQRDTALAVYNTALVSLFFNLLSTPCLAALIARENIVYSSIVQVADTILKIPIALSLILLTARRLEWYAVMTASLSVLNFLCYWIYCRMRYEECKHFSWRDFRWDLSREMLAFTGWTVYGTGCIAARNQGMQVVLNHFYSTVINAAYGMGTQIVNQVSFLATSITTAINPQIIKAEGAHDRARMIRLAESSCKMSFILLGVLVVPVCCSIDDVLGIWLKEVPPYTGLFCSALLIATMADMSTSNLTAANAAIGNIKTYTFVTNTVKILTLPIAYLCLMRGMGPAAAMLVYVVIEALGALIRLIFMKVNIGLSLGGFTRRVLVPDLMVLAANVAVCYSLSLVCHGWSFLVTVMASVLTTGVAGYFFGLSPDEKATLGAIIGTLRAKLFGRMKRID